MYELQSRKLDIATNIISYRHSRQILYSWFRAS